MMEEDCTLHEDFIGQKIIAITHEVMGRIDNIWRIKLENGNVITFEHESSEGSVNLL